MLIFKKSDLITAFIQDQKSKGKAIGFVPTMGALHEGHLSLIHNSIASNQMTVCSIFVNPLQFNKAEDFEKYPNNIEKDIQMLEASGCDVLFLPEKEDIYPTGFVKTNYDLGTLDHMWEGLHRPGHFQGVCNVVKRLLEIVPCDILFLGRKDYQQCMVINKLIDILQLNVKIIIGDTIREKSGLAMSSRNLRLSPEGLHKATIIHQVMMDIQLKIKPGITDVYTENAINQLSSNGFEVEYFSITDNLLNPITYWNGKDPIVCIVAASIEGIRLIDNMSLN